jgi:hypothetical protein
MEKYSSFIEFAYFGRLFLVALLNNYARLSGCEFYIFTYNILPYFLQFLWKFLQQDKILFFENSRPEREI